MSSKLGAIHLAYILTYELTLKSHCIKSIFTRLVIPVNQSNSIEYPPLFGDHLKGPDAKRNQARHNDGLSFMELNVSIVEHLHENGRAWILLPSSEFENFMEHARQQDLQLDHKWLLCSRPQKAPHRVIFSLSHIGSPASTEADKTLCVHGEKGPEYTQAFKSLLKHYYLKF